MSVTLSIDAAEHVLKKLEQRGYGVGLRLGIRVSGCTGFAYVVDYADQIDENDQVFVSHGASVVVNQKSLPHLDGMEIGFTKDNLLNQGFDFQNPNVIDSCGCGESFSLRNA